MPTAPRPEPRHAAIRAAVLPALSRNVVAARTAAGVSQEELARRASIDRTWMSKIERGLANVTVVSLVAIARALDAPLESLLHGVE